jgi:hypothetical protein
MDTLGDRASVGDLVRDFNFCDLLMFADYGPFAGYCDEEQGSKTAHKKPD